MSSNVSGVSNWGSLTASQILAYEEEGADVPDEYLNWAEEAGESSTTTYNDAVGAAQNEADDLRSQLEDSGASDATIAKMFIQKCGEQETLVDESLLQLGDLTSQSEAIVADIQAITNISNEEIAALQTKLQAANAKATTAATTDEATAAQAQAATASAEITDTADSTSTQVAGKSSNISSIATAIDSCRTTTELAHNYADETIDIGNTLTKDKGSILKMGLSSLGGAAAFGGAAYFLLGASSAGIGGALLLGAIISAVVSAVVIKNIAKKAEEAGTELDNLADYSDQVVDTASETYQNAESEVPAVTTVEPAAEVGVPNPDITNDEVDIKNTKK